MIGEIPGPEDHKIAYYESYSASQPGPDDPHHVDVVGGTFVLRDGQLEACKRLARAAASGAGNPQAAAYAYHATLYNEKSNIIGIDPPGTNEFIPATDLLSSTYPAGIRSRSSCPPLCIVF